MVRPAYTEKTVILSKKNEAGALIGMTLATFSTDEESKAHPRITNLHPQGIALASGELAVDDMIISVNGVTCTSDDDAAAQVREAQTDVVLKVRREIKAGKCEVTVRRPTPSAPLGVTLVSSGAAVSTERSVDAEGYQLTPRPHRDGPRAEATAGDTWGAVGR